MRADFLLELCLRDESRLRHLWNGGSSLGTHSGQDRSTADLRPVSSGDVGVHGMDSSDEQAKNTQGTSDDYRRSAPKAGGLATFRRRVIRHGYRHTDYVYVTKLTFRLVKDGVKRASEFLAHQKNCDRGGLSRSFSLFFINNCGSLIVEGMLTSVVSKVRHRALAGL